MEGKLRVAVDIVILLVLRMLLILTLAFKLQFDTPRKEPGVTMKYFLSHSFHIDFTKFHGDDWLQ